MCQQSFNERAAIDNFDRTPLQTEVASSL
jgi:hypothetical protein